MSLSKKTRFSVFDRDNYTCRYCGRTTDSGITLEVDHVVPRAKGGGDEMENLVTSCFDCNRGKSAKEIGTTAPETERDRLRRLQEIAETKRSAEELVALHEAKKERIQAWVNVICSITGEDSANRRFCEQVERLACEFGDATVMEWVSQTLHKFYIINASAAKYLYGIARTARARQ